MFRNSGPFDDSTSEAIASRRFKALYVSPELVINLFGHARAVVMDGIPLGTVVLEVTYDPAPHAFIFNLAHPDFEPVPIEEMPPAIQNGVHSLPDSPEDLIDKMQSFMLLTKEIFENTLGKGLEQAKEDLFSTPFATEYLGFKVERNSDGFIRSIWK